MNELFFELIRVAIGTQEGLSRLPSQKEWKALYDMAKKQSLVGVCFAALQRLGADAHERDAVSDLDGYGCEDSAEERGGVIGARKG